MSAFSHVNSFLDDRNKKNINIPEDMFFAIDAILRLHINVTSLEEEKALLVIREFFRFKKNKMRNRQAFGDYVKESTGPAKAYALENYIMTKAYSDANG